VGATRRTWSSFLWTRGTPLNHASLLYGNHEISVSDWVRSGDSFGLFDPEEPGVHHGL
jgi:hypothetical protein